MPQVRDNKSGKHFFYGPVPDYCPICHHHISPDYINLNIIHDSDHDPYNVEAIYRCPRNECNRAFIARYSQGCVEFPNWEIEFGLLDLVPKTANPIEKENEIKSISSDYVLLYQQSEAAESFGLDHVAGCGYRKALEHLVKDYLMHKIPDRSEEIKKKSLGYCIKNLVDDSKVQLCAEKASWLGNDEVHYYRKWEDKDMKDLKALLRLTENWIVSDLITEKYASSMVEGKNDLSTNA